MDDIRDILFPESDYIGQYANSLYPRNDLLAQSFYPQTSFTGVASYDPGTNQSSDFGQGSLAQGTRSAAFGPYAMASQTGSTAVGFRAQAKLTYTTAVGEESNAAAYASTVVGRIGNVLGIRGVGVGNAVYIAPAATNGVAIGESARLYGPSGVLVGRASTSGTGSGNTLVGQGSSIADSLNNCTLVGQGTAVTVGNGQVAIGQGVTASASAATAVGGASAVSGTNGVAVGNAASAGGTSDTVVGTSASSGTGGSNTAVGASISLVGGSNVAIGASASVTGGNFNTVVGKSATTSGGQDVAIGWTATAGAGGFNTAIGYSATTSSGSTASNVAVGHTASATGGDCTVVGAASAVSGARSTAVGKSNTVTHTDVVVVGNSITSTANGQIILGSSTTNFTDIWFGRGTTHTGAAQTSTVHATDGTGTNVAGDHLALRPGLATGSAATGNIDFYTAVAGGSGTTLQTARLFGRFDTVNGQLHITGNGNIPTGFTGKGIVINHDGSNVAYCALVNADTNASVLSLSVTGTPECAISGNRTGSGTYPPISFYTSAAKQWTLFANGGWGGNGNASQGAGTINLDSIYKNNTAYNNPDFVLEHYFTGKVERFLTRINGKTQEREPRPGAAEYQGLRSLAEVESFAREHFYLPQLDLLKLHDAPACGFDMADMSLLLHEEEFLHLRKLEKRMEELERKCS